MLSSHLYTPLLLVLADMRGEREIEGCPGGFEHCIQKYGSNAEDQKIRLFEVK